MSTMEDVLRPPTEAEVELAVARFARAVRVCYGSRLSGLYLFGSRARGDHYPYSDIDIAVVISDQALDFWKEKTQLTDIAFDADFGTRAYIQAFPFSLDEWSDPARHHNPSLVRAARRDAVALSVPR